MEKLTRRSDRYVETESGLFAVSPRRASGGAGEKAWFEFKASPAAQTVRVEWDKGAELVVIDAGVAASLLRLGFANEPSDEQIERYNSLVAEQEKSAPKKQAKKDEPDPKKDEPDPAKEKASAESKDGSAKLPGGLEPPPGAKV